MRFKILMLLFGALIFVSVGCVRSQSIEPELVQTRLAQAWMTPQHTIWDIDWPAIPLSGPLTVETWRAGSRYRYEILETTAPALAGQTFVFDGQQRWLYNRFEPNTSLTAGVTALSPVSDAFDTITDLLETPSQTASETVTHINGEPAQKIALIFPDGDSLAVWLHLETKLVLQAQFIVDGQHGLLTARQVEVLPDDPSSLLFSVKEWPENVK